MTDVFNLLDNVKDDYSFFDLYKEFDLEQIYDPPYFLEIKLSNFDDDCFVTLETDKVFKINELPQNIAELINKYDFIQHYINCYSNDFYLHFNIKFVSNTKWCEEIHTTHRSYKLAINSFKTFFIIKVDKLKEFIYTFNISNAD